MKPGRSARRHILPRTCLVLIMGVAGSGKTTLAKALLRRVWAVYLDNNHIVDAFFPATRRGASYEKLRPHLYQALYRIVSENLAVGNTIILDVPHVKEMQNRQWRSAIEQMVKTTKTKLLIIRCFCAGPMVRSRLQSRAEPRDRWKLIHWKDFLAEQPIEVPIPLAHLEVDTSKDLSANVRAAMNYLLQEARAGRRSWSVAVKSAINRSNSAVRS